MKRSALPIVGLLVALAAGCGQPERAAAREGFLDGAAGARLHYRVLGSGPDTIVVLHGGPGAGMRSFLPLVEPLAKDHVLVAFDQRGGGRSTLPADTSRLAPRYFVEDLEAVRRHFGLERMNVLAHSFGAVLVAEYAQAHAERLARVALHGATGPDQAQALEIMAAQAEAAAAPTDTALARRAGALLGSLLDGTAADPVATCEAWEAARRALAPGRAAPLRARTTECDAPPAAVRYYFATTAQFAPRAYGGWDYTDRLGRLPAPLLVVYGAEDSLALPAQRAWAAAVPNGRLLLVPGAGKAALAEEPQAALAAIDSFFRGYWPEGARRPE